ncbi:3-oxoacyl-ACP synthase [Leptospira ryugenii]|uniref:3-oxoacyl-ACP synthase n=1 Tax=Leptospira ryugenii TaxID=1917863 RepID=A0A2P2E1Y3_9LEPT|nr:beta-ketoacyl-[acyl-carrier-protein] synthase family protein [Leptospira ryugenii]GBF50907.1 3-oxoacyl-ACP synthase [Leptospira ryugenii]
MTERRNQRVVITGIGVILPNALSVQDFWDHMKKGESQVDFLTRFSTEDIRVKTGAELREFDYSTHLPDLSPAHARYYNRETLAIMSALGDAQKDAGLNRNSVAPSRVGFIDSSSRASLAWWEHAWQIYNDSKDDKIFDKYAVLTSMASNPTNLTAIYANIQGFVTTVTAACVGGHHAVALCYQAIRKNRADVMYAGGHEFPLLKPLIKMYSDPSSSVMSTESKDPKKAMRPYDRSREGFVLGEGAICLCLESYDHAVKRGARIYAEINGTLSYNEASHAMRMDMTGSKAAKGLSDLLRIARHPLKDIDYFCGHGTATHNNDLAESRAIKLLYDGAPVSTWAPVGSIKPIYGHTFGAAGIINLAASALMIHNQTLVPTINLKDPDDECDHDHIAEGYREQKVKNIISLAFAIGSQSSFVSLAKVE